MGSRRQVRSDLPPDPAAVVRALRVCRDTMTTIHRHVKIGGPVYVAATGITKAIDAMAFVLTGDREYFWAQGGGGAPQAHRSQMDEKAARERGEVPWF